MSDRNRLSATNLSIDLDQGSEGEAQEGEGEGELSLSVREVAGSPLIGQEEGSSCRQEGIRTCAPRSYACRARSSRRGGG